MEKNERKPMEVGVVCSEIDIVGKGKDKGTMVACNFEIAWPGKEKDKKKKKINYYLFIYLFFCSFLHLNKLKRE